MTRIIQPTAYRWIVVFPVWGKSIWLPIRWFGWLFYNQTNTFQSLPRRCVGELGTWLLLWGNPQGYCSLRASKWARHQVLGASPALLCYFPRLKRNVPVAQAFHTAVHRRFCFVFPASACVCVLCGSSPNLPSPFAGRSVVHKKTLGLSWGEALPSGFVRWPSKNQSDGCCLLMWIPFADFRKIKRAWYLINGNDLTGVSCIAIMTLRCLKTNVPAWGNRRGLGHRSKSTVTHDVLNVEQSNLLGESD